MQRLEEEALMEECIAYMSNESSSYQNSLEGYVFFHLLFYVDIAPIIA